MDEVKEFNGIKFKVVIPTDREIWNDVAGKPLWKTTNTLRYRYLLQNSGCAKCAFHNDSFNRFCEEYIDSYGHLPCYVPRLNRKQMQFSYCSVIDNDCKATVQ